MSLRRREPRSRLVASRLPLLAALLSFLAPSARAQQGEPGVVPLNPNLTSVRVLLGVKDRESKPWDGQVSVDQGQVVNVEGWRFREGDQMTGKTAWQAQSRQIRRQPSRPGAPTGPGTSGGAYVPNGLVLMLDASKDASVKLETRQGNVTIPLADLNGGGPKLYLNGQVEAQKVPTSVGLVEGEEEADFPACSVDSEGAAWVVYVSHEHRGPDALEAFTERPRNFKDFVPKGGGDQVKLIRFADGKASDTLNVTEAGLDVWRPAVAVDKQGVVVVWAQNDGKNWDLYSRRYDPRAKAFGEPTRLTREPGSDFGASLATDPQGRTWMAWQTWRKGQFDVFLAPLDQPDKPVCVSASLANDWSPALAIGTDGSIFVAYDTYDKGNYDILLWKGSTKGGEGQRTPIAESTRFEVRPYLALDRQNRPWIAYEERTENWGKDAQNLREGAGTTLYQAAAVKVRVLDGERLLDAPDPVAGVADLQNLNSFPRLVFEETGRPWLLFRHRQEAIWGNNTVMVVGGVWLEYATSLDGKSWSPPTVLPRSDGLLDNRPALAATPGGPLLAFYNTDRRLRREVEFTNDLRRHFYTHSGTPPGVVDNDLEVAAIASKPSPAAEPALSPADRNPGQPAPPVHPNEAEDVARLRKHEIKVKGKTYGLYRGDFHRHTEISQDGASDGALEDFWRYALDAAKFDWIGIADHDSGGSKEYTWWLTQKTIDLFHNPPSFVPVFSYERSVSYPDGHRNVMFPYRGVRTLPRLVDEKGVSDNDTKMLYAYLRELGGVCASHTSGTGMGTDWRDNDPKVEPFVEIYQGHRNSYEHLGAPRVARRAGEAIGGFRPLGMVWNALAMQYRLGYQASSDHISTHISYAIAIADEPSREGIFNAFANRHCYGATDNILLDVRAGDHLMGDEFTANGPVSLRIHAVGTGPIAKVDIIKDFVYVYSSQPGQTSVEFEWTDDESRPPGLSWYYVRIQQEDGQIAWGSPIWVHFPAK